jgi:hypothetical protein
MVVDDPAHGHSFTRRPGKSSTSFCAPPGRGSSRTYLCRRRCSRGDTWWQRLHYPHSYELQHRGCCWCRVILWRRGLPELCWARSILWRGLPELCRAPTRFCPHVTRPVAPSPGVLWEWLLPARLRVWMPPWAHALTPSAGAMRWCHSDGMVRTAATFEGRPLFYS